MDVLKNLIDLPLIFEVKDYYLLRTHFAQSFLWIPGDIMTSEEQFKEN